MPLNESLLTVPEAAKRTGVAPRTFWKLIAEGRSPEVLRIGRAVRVRASDLNLWLELGCPSRESLEAEKTARREMHDRKGEEGAE